VITGQGSHVPDGKAERRSRVPVLHGAADGPAQRQEVATRPGSTS
jgi:hypothetical protein